MGTYASRRKSLLAQFKGGVVVLPSAPVAIRNNDVEHEYRQDSDFYYLTGFDEPDAVAVALKDSAPEPIPLDVAFKPAETTPVFTFGFPFGEALSKTKGKPAKDR